MKRAAWVVVCLAVACAPTASDSHHPSAEIIRQRRAAFNGAIGRRDTLAIDAYLADDYRLVTSTNTYLEGRDAGRHVWAEVFIRDSIETYVRNPRAIRVNPEWGHAEEVGQWTGQRRVDGTVVSVGGTYAAKWILNTRDEWRIHTEVFTLFDCVGPSTACSPP